MSRSRFSLPPVISEGVAHGWRALSGSGEAELVPQARFAGPMPWVIAIMVAMTVIAASAGLALRNAAQVAEADLSGGVTVQIVEPRADVRQAQAQAALAVLRDLPGVSAVRLVPRAEVDALVEPWLGDTGSDSADVPVPALIDARLDGTASAARVRQIAERLRAAVPSARVDAQSSWLRPVFAAIASMQWLALALVAMLAAATAAAVLLAARTALGANRDTIEIVHMLGGTDAQIARIFQRSIGFDAAGGGAIGLGLGIVAIKILGSRFAALGAGLAQGGALGWLDWLLIALIPVAGMVLAMVTARISVMRALRQML